MKQSDLTTLRPWLKLIARRRNRLIIGALLMAATVLSAVGLLALSGWFISAAALTGLILAAGMAASLDVYVPGGGIRAFALTRTVSRYLERLYNHDTVLRLLADLRGRTFEQLTRLDAAALSRLRAVQWLNRLTRDVDDLDNLYLRLLAPPLVAALGIVVVGGLIALFLPVPGLVLALALLMLLLALTLGLARLCRTASATLTRDLDDLRTRTVEQLQGLSELSAFQTLTRHQTTLLDSSTRLDTHQTVLARRIAWANALGTFGVQGITVITLLVALSAYQAQWISGPVAVMMPLAVMALGEVFATLPKAFAHAGGTLAAAERLNQHDADHARTLAPAPKPVAPPTMDAFTLHWQAAGVRYGSACGLPPQSLTLKAGERLGVVGPSGSGKSTLAALAVRLQDPDVGEMLINDKALPEVDIHGWRHNVGYLTQQSDLFNETLATNLLLGNPDASDEALWEALTLVDFADAVRAFPDQLNTQVGEGGRQLSGGEARRVALARVILKDPTLVILDEPFSGLDRETAQRIRINLDNWLHGRTLLALGHDSSALPFTDRQITLFTE